MRAQAIQGRIESGAFATTFTLAINGAQARVRLPLAGRHNVSNALGAAAAAHAAGVGLPEIVAGLERMRPVAGRLQLKPGPRGSWLIDDSYNANPSSVRAGIDVLCALPGEHWLVLGEMAELGAETVASHAGIGDLRAPRRHHAPLCDGRGGAPRGRRLRRPRELVRRMPRSSPTRWPRASSPG